MASADYFECHDSVQLASLSECYVDREMLTVLASRFEAAELDLMSHSATVWLDGAPRFAAIRETVVHCPWNRGGSLDQLTATAIAVLLQSLALVCG